MGLMTREDTDNREKGVAWQENRICGAVENISAIACRYIYCWVLTASEGTDDAVKSTPVLAVRDGASVTNNVPSEKYTM